MPASCNVPRATVFRCACARIRNLRGLFKPRHCKPLLCQRSCAYRLKHEAEEASARAAAEAARADALARQLKRAEARDDAAASLRRLQVRPARSCCDATRFGVWHVVPACLSVAGALHMGAHLPTRVASWFQGKDSVPWPGSSALGSISVLCSCSLQLCGLTQCQADARACPCCFVLHIVIMSLVSSACLSVLLITIFLPGGECRSEGAALGPCRGPPAGNRPHRRAGEAVRGRARGLGVGLSHFCCVTCGTPVAGLLHYLCRCRRAIVAFTTQLVAA